MRHTVQTLTAIVAIANFAADMPLARAQQTAAPTSSTAAASHAESAAETAFLNENDTAMAKMMAGMDVKPTGDIDADFEEMMTPHHQGAIDMALAELRYGKNEQLRRIAQEIIVDQQQEITAMCLALGKALPPSVASPTQVQPAKTAPVSAMQPASSMQMPMPMNMPAPITVIENASR